MPAPEVRLKTYVKGLDEQLQGGIPKSHIVLLAGKPGTMKSSIAFNVLYNNAKEHNLGAVYVTLEQGRNSLLTSMANLGMDIAGMEKKFSVLDLSLIRKKLKQLSNRSWIEVFKMYIDNLDQTMDVALLAIDSLPVLEVLAKFQEPRDDLFNFFEWLRDLEITSFLITEMEQDSDKFCNYGEDFLSDGIVHLDLRRRDQSVDLYMSVVKMRKTAHRRGYYPLIYDEGGFELVTH
ncbi:MAG TPA: ATPase domain-containing protein [Thermoplasmata archaeon]|nr:ATPase domain-containing protein [Thermoplasmata archaeon]